MLGDELRTRSRAAASCSAGVRPSGARVTAPASTCWRRPAMRTWKNSSRLPAKIARNLTRSRSGLRASRASWRTRALNSSQDSSRFRYGSSGCSLRARRGRAGARDEARVPGSTAAISRGRLQVGFVRAQASLSAGWPARIARPDERSGTRRIGQSSATYRRSPDTGSSLDAHPQAGRRVLEALVGRPEARVEARPVGSPPPGPGAPRSFGLGRAIARPFDDRRDDQGEPDQDRPVPDDAFGGPRPTSDRPIRVRTRRDEDEQAGADRPPSVDRRRVRGRRVRSPSTMTAVP